MLAVTTPTFVATSLAIVLPWVFSIRKSPFSWSTVTSLLLLSHTVLGLYSLILKAPPNIFTTLQLPINAPTDVIRALLLNKSESPELSGELEGLLQRLSSFKARTLYPRFGHNVVATCDYCYTFTDFAFYALPRPVLSYLREVAFIGLIAPNRRRAGVATAVFMGIAELYLLASAVVTVPPRGEEVETIMWHDILLTIRRSVFIILPLILHYLPPLQLSLRPPFITRIPPPTGPQVATGAALMATHQALSHLLPTLHFLKYSQAATMRVPELRARSTAWWEEEARVGNWIREGGHESGMGSVSVDSVAAGLGIPFNEEKEGLEEGKLRTSARQAALGLLADGGRVREFQPNP